MLVAASARAEHTLEARIRVVEALLDHKVDRRTSMQVSIQVLEVSIDIGVLKK